MTRLPLLLALLAATPTLAGGNLVLDELPPPQKGKPPLAYALYLPKSLDATKPAPLILAVHGGNGTAEKFARFLGPLAEARKAIVACPQAFEELVGGDGFWWRNDGEEMAALDRLVAHVKKSRSVDADQVSALGLADGGELLAAYAFSKDRGLKGVLLLNCLWLYEKPFRAEKTLRVCVIASREAEEKTSKLRDHAEKAHLALTKQKVAVVTRIVPGSSRTFFHGWEEEFRKAFDWFSGTFDWPRQIDAEKAAPPPPSK